MRCAADVGRFGGCVVARGWRRYFRAQGQRQTCSKVQKCKTYYDACNVPVHIEPRIFLNEKNKKARKLTSGPPVLALLPAGPFAVLFYSLSRRKRQQRGGRRWRAPETGSVEVRNELRTLPAGDTRGERGRQRVRRRARRVRGRPRGGLSGGDDGTYLYVKHFLLGLRLCA